MVPVWASIPDAGRVTADEDPSGLELVIFDCDGVLVDIERLHVRTEAALLSDLG
jgi:hypothetical protein